nr:thymidine kinase [uncultured Anaerotignum sp.]
MAKLYFRYGVMGSSKSAQALITKFNYEERGMRVWLMKPAADTRYGVDKVHSRIGLEQSADAITEDMDLYELFRGREREFYDVIIVDEAQFLQPTHVEQLRDIVDNYNVPVLCFGLRTDFRTKLFPGSARLFELADSVTELKTVCTCGGKAMVNARVDAEGSVVTEGEQFLLGGNESYRPMCYKCWKKAQKKQAAEQ